MRVPVLTILLALAPAAAAADDTVRARLSGYIADHGGCAGSRALVERELVAFERGRAEGGVATLLLFGKPAPDWHDEEIGDLVAVIRACEALRPHPGRSAEEGERRLAERLERLAQAMRRAIVLSARPSELLEASALPGPAADARIGSGPGAHAPSAGRPRQGPAFVPVGPARPAPAAGTALRSTSREGLRAPAEAPGPTSGMASAAMSEAFGPSRRDPARAAPLAPGSVGAETGPAFRRAAFAGGALAAPLADAPAPRPCAVTMERFERIGSGMTPPEVEAVFGCRGRIDSATAIEGLGTFEVYVWSPPSRDGSVTVTFQDRRLKAKVQRGLI